MAEMEKKTVNAMGDVCPVPLVKAKNAIAELAGSGKVEVLVDNEIAVQNLEKMAQQCSGDNGHTEDMLLRALRWQLSS